MLTGAAAMYSSNAVVSWIPPPMTKISLIRSLTPNLQTVAQIRALRVRCREATGVLYRLRSLKQPQFRHCGSSGSLLCQTDYRARYDAIETMM